jgi:hypothetical protein
MRVIGWGMTPETVFPRGTTTIGPEESPQEIIQHWHGERGHRRTVEQLPLRIRLRIEGMGDRGRTIKASGLAKLAAVDWPFQSRLKPLISGS